MTFLILFLFLVSPKLTFAQDLTPISSPTSTLTPTDIAPSLTVTSTSTPNPTTTSIPTISLIINSLPSQSVRGETFTLNITLSNGSTLTEYYFKAYGGVSSDYSIEVFANSTWSNGYNGSWINMPKFTTNVSGQITENIFIKARGDQETGTFNIVAKVKEVNGDIGVTSPIKTLLINSQAPSITPTITSSPSLTPAKTPTPIKTPTPTPIIFTATTSIPAKTPTPRPTSSPIPTLNIPTLPDSFIPEPTLSNQNLDDSLISTPEPTGVALGISDISFPTPTIKPLKISGISSNILPIIFIGAGALMLIVPLVLSLRK